MENNYNQDDGYFKWIRNNFQDKQILEFGSGEGTIELLKDNFVTSIEHDKTYAINRGTRHIMKHFPIKNVWYNLGEERTILKEFIENSVDLIIVDGPPKELKAGILHHLDLFWNYKGTIIFDDTNRVEDLVTMEEFCKLLNFSYEIINGEQKEFAMCKPKDKY